MPSDPHMLSAASANVVEQTLAEVAMALLNNRTSSIEPNILVTRQVRLIALLTPLPTELAADAPDELAGLRHVLGEGIGEVATGLTMAPLAVNSRKRHSRETALHCKAGAKVYASLRRRAKERIPRTAANAELRRLLGVNADVNEANPLSLLGGLLSQERVLGNPEHQALLDSFGMNTRKCLQRLAPVIVDLKNSIPKGTTGEKKKREVGATVMKGLVKVEIAASRARAFLEDYVSEAAAATFDAAIPRRHETPEPDSEPESETEPDEEAELEPEAKVEPEADAKSKTKAETEATAEKKTDASKDAGGSVEKATSAGAKANGPAPKNPPAGDAKEQSDGDADDDGVGDETE